MIRVALICLALIAGILIGFGAAIERARAHDGAGIWHGGIGGQLTMGQVSDHFRRGTNGYMHWCPGCEEMHLIPDSWSFNGDFASPTFQPSVKITGVKTVKDKHGKWTGEWVKDEHGKPVPDCCHYILTAGQLQFCGDSLHALAGQTVPLPPLPDWLRDQEP